MFDELYVFFSSLFFTFFSDFFYAFEFHDFSYPTVFGDTFLTDDEIYAFVTLSLNPETYSSWNETQFLSQESLYSSSFFYALFFGLTFISKSITMGLLYNLQPVFNINLNGFIIFFILVFFTLFFSLFIRIIFRNFFYNSSFLNFINYIPLNISFLNTIHYYSKSSLFLKIKNIYGINN